MGEMSVNIRPEMPDDIDAINNVIIAAFKNRSYSQQNEHKILQELRNAGVLTLSFVAVNDAGNIVGQIAFSLVEIDSRKIDWYGLGPVSVIPDEQRKGIGSKLIQAGLAELKKRGAEGVVVLGDPNYYGRFGFRTCPYLIFEGGPAEHFMCHAFSADTPSGIVTYHQAFSAQ